VLKRFNHSFAFLALLVLGLPRFAAAADTDFDCTPTVFSATATWYDNSSLGLAACHFSDATLPGGSTMATQYYAAVATHLYDADLCGACAEITDTSNSNKVTVMITDECPAATNPTHCSAGSNHLDISQNAFDDLRPLSTGVFNITWKVVPCPNNLMNTRGQMGSSLTYQFKSGASSGWATILIKDYIMPIRSVEYCSSPGGGCVAAAWQRSYNGWVPSGSWSSFYLRITDKGGNAANFGPISCCSPVGNDTKGEAATAWSTMAGGQMPSCGPAGTATRTPLPSPTPTTCVCSPTFTRTPTPAPADCPLLLNGNESAALTDNGSWTGANATRSRVTSPAGAITEGASTMKVQINTAAPYNSSIAALSGFAPTDWTPYTRLTASVYVDPAALPWSGASTFHQLALQGAAASVSKYQQDIASGVANLVSGMNNVSFNLTFPGTINPGDPMSDLWFNLSEDGQQTGVIYIDNIVLHTDLACPPASPTPSATRTRTPSPTGTGTRTATPSATPSNTPLPASFTSTLTPSRTASPSPSETPSRTETRTVTGTSTGTLTPVPATASSTRTDSPTQSATRTVTLTATPTLTVPVSTATPSRTATATSSSTGSPSATRSATGTATPSRTPSSTSTVTVVLPTSTSTETPLPGATVTSTSTISPTRSATPTVSPSLTRSPTGSSTVTSSGTPTRTSVPPSSTPTVTATQTAVLPSATSSATPLPGSTSTSTSTISPTRSATPSASPSSSSTGTRTASPTASPLSTATSSRTASPSATQTVLLPTSTQTVTPPPGSTATSTSTISPSRTASPTATASSSATPSFTVTATASPVSTATPSRTATGSSTATVVLPSSTFTGTPPPGSTATFTSTITRTATPSATAAAATATSTRTITAVSTVPASTLTATPSASPTALPPSLTGLSPSSGTESGGTSVVLTGSNIVGGAVVLVDGVAVSATFNGPGQLTVSMPAHAPGAVTVQLRNPDGQLSASQSFTYLLNPASATVTPSATAGIEGPCEIEQHGAWPSPYQGGPGWVSAKLAGRADGVTLKIYTKAMACIGTQELGPQGAGWVKIPLPSAFSDAPVNGTYFYVISIQRNGHRNLKHSTGKIMVLR
jgi:expansin (peptidoglycan-binding protein)